MGLFILAWLFGEGIITYRTAQAQRMPPSPRQLLLSSGLFAALGVIGEIPGARNVAAAAAWALDLAILLQVLPELTTAKSATTGWSAIPEAGNTVIIPTGTSASEGSEASSPGTSTGQAGQGGTAAQNQAIAQQVIASNSQFAGWGTGQQWTDLVQLWNRESGWSASADNAQSGAYGIAQSLHGTEGGKGGNEYNASLSEGLSASQLAGANAGNAADQILWGLNYIAATYGSPSAAWQHEQTYGWY